MAAPVTAPPEGQPARITPRLWLAAGLEIALAIAVATLATYGTRTPHTPDNSHSGMHEMHTEAVAPQWSVATTAVGLLAAGALVWWVMTRARPAAATAAASLAVLAAAPTVRALAVTSHLIAMTALEILAVAAPLLLITAVRPQSTAGTPRPSRSQTLTAVVATACYAGLIIFVHLPVTHDRAGHLAMIPLWLAPVIAAVGVAYWVSILTTAGNVSTSIRRRALIIGQEVGAILGLAAIIHPTTMSHPSPLGISSQLDHRLGGLLMLITCAAVTLPLLNTLKA